jgi:hypothetical protein
MFAKTASLYIRERVTGRDLVWRQRVKVKMKVVKVNEGVSHQSLYQGAGGECYFEISKRNVTVGKSEMRGVKDSESAGLSDRYRCPRARSMLRTARLVIARAWVTRHIRPTKKSFREVNARFEAQSSRYRRLRSGDGRVKA